MSTVLVMLNGLNENNLIFLTFRNDRAQKRKMVIIIYSKIIIIKVEGKTQYSSKFISYLINIGTSTVLGVDGVFESH